MPVPVEDKPTERPVITGTVSGAITDALTFDGSASAASRHIIASGDTLSVINGERLRLSFEASDNVRELVGQFILGPSAHPFAAAFTINAISAGSANDKLSTGVDTAMFPVSEAFRFKFPSAVTTVDIVGRLPASSTLASANGSLIIHGVSYA